MTALCDKRNLDNKVFLYNVGFCVHYYRMEVRNNYLKNKIYVQSFSAALSHGCVYCNGLLIDSFLYLYGRITQSSSDKYVQKYKIDDSETFTIEYQVIYGLNPYLGSFDVKDQIFFRADDGVPKVNTCEVGYRKENSICMDIDECEIHRHYCDTSR